MKRTVRPSVLILNAQVHASVIRKTGSQLFNNRLILIRAYFKLHHKCNTGLDGEWCKWRAPILSDASLHESQGCDVTVTLSACLSFPVTRSAWCLWPVSHKSAINPLQRFQLVKKPLILRVLRDASSS